MVIISYAAIRNFCKDHPEATDAMNNWYYQAEEADWSNFHDAKNTFNNIDAVGNDHYVFNVRGNRFRIIAIIKFTARTVYLRFVGTHADYNKVDASTI